jgi:hypothetical protein
LLGLLLGSVSCPLAVQLLATEPLGGSTGAERARDEVLDIEAPRIVRDLDVASPDPGNLGPAAVAWLARHFRNAGDAVLRSSSMPGRPRAETVAGSIDVRLVRTAPGDVLSGSTESETITICLRFETRWSDTYGARTSFGQIGCP